MRPKIVLTSVAKAIEGPSLSFECIDNISGKNCFPLGVLRVSHCVPHHVLQEHSEHSSHLKIAILVEYQLSKKKSCLSQEIKITELVCNLLIDEPWYSFDASPSRKTPYSRLCDPLDVVPQHLQPGAQVNTKDRVLRKSLLYLSVSLCSPLPKAFAPLAPPVIGHSSPFSSFLVRSEFRLLPILLKFGHVRFPWFVLVLATATTPLRRDGEKAKSENVSTNESARGERRPMGGDLVFVALFNCLE